MGKVTIGLCENCIEQRRNKMLKRALIIRIFFAVMFSCFGMYLLFFGPKEHKIGAIGPFALALIIMLYALRLMVNKMILTREIFSEYFTKALLPNMPLLHLQVIMSPKKEDELLSTLLEIPILDRKKTFLYVFPESDWRHNEVCDVCKKTSSGVALVWPLYATLCYIHSKSEFGATRIEVKYSDFKEMTLVVCEECFLKQSPHIDLLESLKASVNEKAKPLFQDKEEWKKWGFISEESLEISVLTKGDFNYIVENFKLTKQ